MRRALTALVLALLAFAPAAAAVSSLFVVNTTLDEADGNPGDGQCETIPGNGVCSLRAAVMEANALNHQPVTILLPAGTYTLTRPPTGAYEDDATGDLDVTEGNVTVIGGVRGATVIDANELDRVFNVGWHGQLAMSDLVLRRGRPQFGGGAIFAATPFPFVLERVRIEDSQPMSPGPYSGGCIYLDSAPATLVDLELTGCSAQLGGGIEIEHANVELSRSWIHGNQALGGSAIYIYYSTVVVRDSTISENVATSGCTIVTGGALSDVVIENSTVSGNLSYGNGGATCGSVRILFSTIASNQADLMRMGLGTGGGIYAGPQDAVSVQDSILAGNIQSLFVGSQWIPIGGDCAGSISAFHTNLIESPTCTIGGYYLHGPALIGGLAWNGGPTPTHRVLEGSWAVDETIHALCIDHSGQPLTKDQRGATRSVSYACDLGSVERGPCGDANGDGGLGVADVFWLINFLFAGGDPPVGIADANDDHVADVRDVFYVINRLFAGGVAPICP
jgi:CSLREA domain-containing protein